MTPELELADRNPRNEKRIVAAVCAVIRAAGWSTMATQFREEPYNRARVVIVIARDIARKFGPDKASRFAALASTVFPSNIQERRC